MSNLNKCHILVTYDPKEKERALLKQILGEKVYVTFLKDLPLEKRILALKQADILLSWNLPHEMYSHEYSSISNVRLLQLLSAGADHIPFSSLPQKMIISSNAGAYAEPMAEHVLAMALALAKRLLIGHQKLAHGEFDQFSFNRLLRGSICGILGFGGIGKATARLMRPLGVGIYAINRSGQTKESIEFIGTLNDLKHVLSTSDIVVISLPFNKTTHTLISRKELSWMKPDAILINVARGEIIDEQGLYEHLRDHPEFMVGIDAWWVEPFRYGEFRVDYPFFQLPNVLGSPHNAAMVPGAMLEGVEYAAENILRFLRGDPLNNVVQREDYID